MYGNFEYGTVPYGDTGASPVIIIIVVTRNNIELLFLSNVKPNQFISQRKKSIFISEPFMVRD